MTWRNQIMITMELEDRLLWLAFGVALGWVAAKLVPTAFLASRLLF